MVGRRVITVYSSKAGRDDEHLDTKTVEGSTLSLEGVDDVESGDGLSLGVLRVGDGVSDDI
jgi:hypothetical protein